MTYDPSFAYELAIIIREGIRRMYEEQEEIFYYLTVYNENYTHPKMPEGVEEGILKGIYCFNRGPEALKKNTKATRFTFWAVAALCSRLSMHKKH